MYVAPARCSLHDTFLAPGAPSGGRGPGRPSWQCCFALKGELLVRVRVTCTVLTLISFIGFSYITKACARRAPLSACVAAAARRGRGAVRGTSRGGGARQNSKAGTEEKGSAHASSAQHQHDKVSDARPSTVDRRRCKRERTPMGIKSRTALVRRRRRSRSERLCAGLCCRRRRRRRRRAPPSSRAQPAPSGRRPGGWRRAAPQP